MSTMRKHFFLILILITSFAATALTAHDADARKRKKKVVKKAAVTQKANVAALRELMGAFKFGMTREEVVAVVSKQIEERYAEQIAGTNDVYQQDTLRADQRKEVKRLEKSYVEFSGKKGGWDVSIIDDQFKHGTEESMMIFWEIHEGKNQRRFFFFHQGKLYKMFIALDTGNLGEDQKNFTFFKSLMENRFGPGQVLETGLAWHLKDIHVDALDKLAFYNAFCLVVIDPKRQEEVFAMRADRIKEKKNTNILDSVTDDGSGVDLDEGSDVIDRVIEKPSKKKK